MLAYCTYCSAEKNKSENSIQAIDLYHSTRIETVYKSAQSNDIKFVILSGKYGLIPAHQMINYYDHLLIAKEVEKHSDLVAKQINKLGINELVFFSNRIKNERNLVPYITCIKKACIKAGVRLSIKESNFND